MISTHDFIAAAFALFALGANVIGTILLLMLNPRNDGIRWYAVFNAFVAIWLITQAALALNINSALVRGIFEPTVHMMPAVFLTAAVADMSPSVKARIAIVVFAALLYPVLLFADSNTLVLTWQVVAWLSAATLHAVRHLRRTPVPERAPGARRLYAILTIIVPIGVVGAILLKEEFVYFALPTITVVALILIFVGVVHHQFYNIEVRAARTGEIAAQAAEQERLAVVGELAASLAHEIRNPLTGMRSLTQQIAEQDLDTDKRARYSGIVLGEIDRLERIVSNLLEVAKRGSDAPSAVNPITELSTLFADLALLVETRARRAGNTLRITTSAGISVRAPRELLAQALLNLLLNAIQHAPPGTDIELRVEGNGDFTEIVVRDHGPGITDAEKERIFEPFHSGSSGTGLGLAVVRRIAREQNWLMKVVDPHGGGTEFRVAIPRVNENGASA